ncbi:MAG: hypothetical protein M1823_000586 [Watsoniomyces obsoletus]|nr:MAG: hypothetical protein M1823_000586 [Watsoniomyces obsoletus]
MSSNGKANSTSAPSSAKNKKANRRNKNKSNATTKVEKETAADVPDEVEEPEPEVPEEAPAEASNDVPSSNAEDQQQQPERSIATERASPNGVKLDMSLPDASEPSDTLQHSLSNGTDSGPSQNHDSSSMETRLAVMSQERESLQMEVKELREELEVIQKKHEEDVSILRNQLEDASSGKEHAEQQYRNLLGKLNTIKSQLGERLKADAEDLSQARTQIEQLEESNKSLQEDNGSLQSRIDQLHQEGEQRSKELSALRNRTTLSQQNWLKEREDLRSREAVVREEFEAAKQAMQDWEVLAMEERSIRENLTDRVSVLEEQLSGQTETLERVTLERDDLSQTVDGLQRALQDLQDARKQELRELVETSQSQLETLRKKVQESEIAVTESQRALDVANKELERALPLEKEVKEKNLLIGKLRHEAVILNDHLTKALRFLRKGKPEDNVDRQIVTNHFLQFLALDRADPKKFQVLQLIAALLNWTEEQREQAGLSRPGTSGGNSLRAPLSPFHRTPSTPSTSTEFFTERTSRKESLAELWSNFLEQEAQTDSGGGGGASTSPLTPRTPHPPG